jgi:pyruvate dehydrogenase E1 component alpha subunit
MKRDPILILRDSMAAAGELAEGDLAKLDEEAKAIAQDAWDFADQSPEPPVEELTKDVLVEGAS